MLINNVVKKNKKKAIRFRLDVHLALVLALDKEILEADRTEEHPKLSSSAD